MATKKGGMGTFRLGPDLVLLLGLDHRFETGEMLTSPESAATCVSTFRGMSYVYNI